VARGAAALELDAPPLHVQSMEALYACHAPGLRRRCLGLTRDADAADELMQEVFVRFIERFPHPPAEMDVSAYLKATARNVLWKRLRDEHEVPDGDLAASFEQDDDLEIDPERSTLLGEQRGVVRRCAALLTGRQQRALTLRDVEGHSYAEIGAELGIGTDAVAQVISRARIRLRGALRRAEIDLDALPPECRDLVRPLSEYLDGRAALHAPEIEAHLAGCAACRQTLALFEEAGSRLRGVLPLAPLGWLVSRLRGQRAAGLAQASGDAPLHGAAVATAAVAAVIALTGGGVVAHQLLESSPSGHHHATAVPLHGVPHAARIVPAVASGPPSSLGGSRGAPVLVASSIPPASHAVTSRGGAARTHVLHALPGATPGTTPTVQAPAATPIVKGAPAAPPTRVTPKHPVLTTPHVPVTTPANVPVIVTPPLVTPSITTPVVTVPAVTVPVTPVVPPVHLPAIGLGASASYGVLSGAGITNTGATTISGDIGAFPTLAITGLASLLLTGSNQAGNATTQQAKLDLATAYAAAAGKPATAPITADLGGRTLTPGVYGSASSVGITGTLTLDGQGDPDAVFVIEAGSTLTTASASQIVLTGGARSCNVFWQVGSSATLGTGSTFRGTILALTSITVTTGVAVDGRLLARNGAITLDSDAITRSAAC
jgi:RNA polymerase sigma factor (sigma-70 family)